MDSPSRSPEMLRDLRVFAGLTTDKLVALAGCSGGLVRRFEAGIYNGGRTRPPAIDECFAVLDRLDSEQTDVN